MKNQTRYTRIVLAVLGLWTVVQSVKVILIATAQLGAWHQGPPSDAPTVVLLFGVLLALGGGCLTVRGIKYQGRAAKPGCYTEQGR